MTGITESVQYDSGRSGGTGRRAGLKIPYRQLCVGSTPSSGTIFLPIRRRSRLRNPRGRHARGDGSKPCFVESMRGSAVLACWSLAMSRSARHSSKPPPSRRHPVANRNRPRRVARHIRRRGQRGSLKKRAVRAKPARPTLNRATPGVKQTRDPNLLHDEMSADRRTVGTKPTGSMPRGLVPATVNLRYFFTLKKAVMVEPSLAVMTARKHKSAPLTFGVFQFWMN